MQLFHYHLVTAQLRDVEARYLGKLGFNLVARYGRVGDEHVAVEAGVSWEKLDEDGFKPRLSELERGAVNVVVQPGHWRAARRPPRRGTRRGRVPRPRSSARPSGISASRSTAAADVHRDERGYRLEIHPPRAWIEDLLAHEDDLRLAELQLRADDPRRRQAPWQTSSGSTSRTRRC